MRNQLIILGAPHSSLSRAFSRYLSLSHTHSDDFSSPTSRTTLQLPRGTPALLSFPANETSALVTRASSSWQRLDHPLNPWTLQLRTPCLDPAVVPVSHRRRVAIDCVIRIALDRQKQWRILSVENIQCDMCCRCYNLLFRVQIDCACYSRVKSSWEAPRDNHRVINYGWFKEPFGWLRCTKGKDAR